MNNVEDRPLVSVITPCYNGEPYLKECIESVLSQTYPSFEYIIVDNKSNDGSLETAERYARMDARIKVVKTEEFLLQMDNFNYAVRQMSDQSKFCKIVQADDRIFPDCLAKMVEVAESNPSVGIVSAYTLLDHGDHTRIYHTGLPYSCSVTSGRDACRRFIMDGINLFGSPTSTLISSEIMRSIDPFYDAKSVIPDAEICFRALTDVNVAFGFVHEILTYTRRYNDSIMTVLSKLHYWQLTMLIVIRKYGHNFLEEEELERRRRTIERDYEKAIGESMLLRLPDEFWQFHKGALQSTGYDLSIRKRLWCLALELFDLTLNPKRTLERIGSYRRRKTSKVKVDSGKITDYYDLDVK